MPTRLRKTRKRRGSRTMGWGQVNQHRKHGAKGGYGRAGRHKHKWSWVTAYQPDYFGSHGFVTPNPSKTEKWLNVGQVEQLAEKYMGDDGILDLVSLGIEKLLGSGRISKGIKIRVTSATESARKKVEEAGGELLIAKAEVE